MKKVFLIVMLLPSVACLSQEALIAKISSADRIISIAFGSCGHQNDPQPVLGLIAAQKPDLFIYLGDNIYSDTHSMDTLRMNYNILAAKSEFKALKEATKILATWDDHDYGWNDAGRHYPYKTESKKIFLDFFGIPDPSMLNRDGIYYSTVLSEGEKKIQIIMLDMRTFRDKLQKYNGNRKGDIRFNYAMDYSPYASTDSTMLGEDQWQWLERKLLEPADVRVIASSTQFGITHNGYEAWANFPHEQKRMTDLIRKTRSEGVLFISGDVHYAEISRLSAEGLYPIYDITSSGITSTWEFATPNDHRIDGPVMENHFGLLLIDLAKTDPAITMEIHDVYGKTRVSRIIKLSELKF